MEESIIGFWFAVYQPDPSRNRVKAWLDGDENYQLIRIDDFMKLAQQAEAFGPISVTCREYSFFMWDVAKKDVRRVSFKEPPEPLGTRIASSGTAPVEAQVADKYWHQEIDLPTEGASPKIRTG